MLIIDNTINKINEIAAGREFRRKILGWIVGSSFAAVTFLFAAIPVYIDSFFGSAAFIVPPLSIYASLLLFIPGLILMCWTSILFFRTKGTPVPVNPPQKLVTYGPYKYTRNPMHTGLFLVMIASGFFYGSVLSLLVFTPVYIFLDTLMIKYIEEPGLAKRLGEDYVKYRERTPMFFPWR